jgi:hypothetical protein
VTGTEIYAGVWRRAPQGLDLLCLRD